MKSSKSTESLVSAFKSFLLLLLLFFYFFFFFSLFDLLSLIPTTFLRRRHVGSQQLQSARHLHAFTCVYLHVISWPHQQWPKPRWTISFIVIIALQSPSNQTQPATKKKKKNSKKKNFQHLIKETTTATTTLSLSHGSYHVLKLGSAMITVNGCRKCETGFGNYNSYWLPKLSNWVQQW